MKPAARRRRDHTGRRRAKEEAQRIRPTTDLTGKKRKRESIQERLRVRDGDDTLSAPVLFACNQCHLDRSVNWAVTEPTRLWPARFEQTRESEDPQFEIAEGPRACLRVTR
jgi:hypothetical protein